MADNEERMEQRQDVVSDGSEKDARVKAEIGEVGKGQGGKSGDEEKTEQRQDVVSDGSEKDARVKAEIGEVGKGQGGESGDEEKTEQRQDVVSDGSEKDARVKAEIGEVGKGQGGESGDEEKTEQRQDVVSDGSEKDARVKAEIGEVGKGQGGKSGDEVKAENKKDEEREKKEGEVKTESKEGDVRGKKEVVKKTETFVNLRNLPISTKHSMAICRFIKRKGIEDAIKDLEGVLTHSKAVPMKGEIPHRKGKGMMSGRYPKNATEQFIVLLKSLLANSNNLNVDNPFIVEAVANIGHRPFGKSGRVRKKRTHIKIVARTMEVKK